MIRVCFHGAESTGKSVLARKLAGEFVCPLVPEFGRIYAENVTTYFTMPDLLEIADEQDRLMRISCEGDPRLVLLDTDPLMTAAWAQMLFGEIPGELLEYDKAELYLLFSPDVPWVADGTRFFGTPELRAQFAATAEGVLRQVGVVYETVSGDFADRERQARAAIARMFG
ncbi:ATP-binding protein [Tsuneonella flava]|uniref:ATP-binding protein n=1 Tax=Tsuneonella flava TaxID=2055955 RepID=A0ABX7KD65_9SPHN|nr:ATP-binding protein [Tsuneonella flava]QSB45753.1 ATP-binding protein [Tsuneonella flava]